VHRLDRINAKKPAKLLDSKSLTFHLSCKQNLAGFFQFPVNLTRRDAVWTRLLYKAGSGKVAQVLAMSVVWAFTVRLAGLPVPGNVSRAMPGDRKASP
jgi:hypothetical protein